MAYTYATWDDKVKTRLTQVVDSLACTSLLWLGMANKMLQKKKKKKTRLTLFFVFIWFIWVSVQEIQCPYDVRRRYYDQ